MRSEEDKALALAAMAANFGTDIPEPLLDLWLDLLRPYSAWAVSQAVRQVVMDRASATLPPFAVLRSALEAVTGTGADALGMRAAAEWGRLLETAGECGDTRAASEHPTTAFVVGLMGGREAVRAWTEEGLERRRAEFIHLWTESHGNVDSLAFGTPPPCAADDFHPEDDLPSSLGIPGIPPGIIADCGGLQ